MSYCEAHIPGLEPRRAASSGSARGRGDPKNWKVLKNPPHNLACAKCMKVKRPLASPPDRTAFGWVGPVCRECASEALKDGS
jgi:hypothetical protein